jgi:isopropylmalate/homocitrate/citramalate synthase
MIDRSKVWTGAVNEVALAGRPKPKVGFYDTTLRDGEQAVGVIFDPAQKLEIAKLIDGLGIGRIEAGFPKVSAEDAEAIRMISSAGLKAEIWGFSRAIVDDVAAVADLGLKYTVIEAPVSHYKLGAFGIAPESVVDRIRKAIEFAVKNGIRVAYFAVDATRADLTFLERVYKTALDAGAKELVMVDTIGIATPEAVSYLVGKMTSWAGPNIPLHFHGHNDFGLATACAVAAVQAGATWIQGSIDGIGERGGNGNIPEIALAMELAYGFETGIHLDRIRTASERVREIARYSVEPWKPAVGTNLFVRETGAVAAQFHVPESIEPYSSTLLNTPRGIVLGKKSGAASIEIKCKELGLAPRPETIPVLLAEVKKRAIGKRGLLTDAEFIEVVKRHG